MISSAIRKILFSCRAAMLPAGVTDGGEDSPRRSLRRSLGRRPAIISRAIPVFPFLGFLLLVSTPCAHAQLQVVKGGETIEIRLPVLSGPAGAEATRILSGDLERSGWFKVVGSGGEYSLQGSASASSVQCKVFRHDGVSALTATGSGALRRAVHQVADQIVAKLTGHKGIAQTRIAFISDKTGSKELCVMDYDGYGIQRLTSDKSVVLSPHFSRQANRIVCTSYRSGYPDIFVLSYPPATRQAVARFPGLNASAAFSPNGGRLALTLSKDGNPELYTMSVGGGDLKRLTRTRGGESSPSWSPDGGEIVYCSDTGGRPQLYIVASAGGEPRRLTTSPAYNTEPDWSAESGLIACSSGGGSRFSVSVIDPKGGRASGDVLYSDGSCEDPSWAPDGRHIVFTRRENGRADLYVLDTASRQAVQLTRDFGNCSQPAWSGK